jgi:hypothetical protein
LSTAVPSLTMPYPGSSAPYQRLPTAALRDLLGLARCLHRAWRAAGAPAARLAELERVGRQLGAALRASRLHPGTLPHIEAWPRAEAAVARLGELIAEHDTAALVEATAGLVRLGRK